MDKKYIVGGVAILLIAAFLAWLFIASSQPLPGQKITDLGRKHIQIGEEVNYNSNPPTSGPHYEDWIRAGVYETSKDDRNLVHSLEHGYIIMSYKCPISPKEIVEVQLELDEKSGSPSATTTSATEEEIRSRDEQCEERKNQLTQIYEKKSKRKLIVIPRLDLDTNFALTAWNYLDKFDQFDGERIEKFIDAHLNMGPEKTME